MMRKILLTVLLLANIFNASSQCVENSEKKILLIGDSWAFFMNADATFNNVLNHWGFTNKEYFSNVTLAVNGAQTEDFLTEARMTEIQNQLNANPSISVVHVSLSGNDFLGAWNVDFTPTETEALSDETYDEIVALTDFIKTVRPGIRIVFSGYMYANFAEVIDDAAPFETSHPFYGNWESMGFPTFEQLNSMLNDFSDRIYDLTLSDPQLDFINAPALMQYHFGQASPLGVDPGGTYPALFQPLPYGDVTYPSPKVSMRDYGITRDCFHLSAEGFFTMIDFQFQKLYHKLLMDDAYFLADSFLENGSISASGDVSSELKLGQNGGEDFASILSFNTTSLADTVIESASLFLRREGVVGGNPLGTTLTLRMKSGVLGSSVNVDADDFSDEGDIMEAACVFGLSSENSEWIRIDLPESFLPFISNDNITQFALLIADASGEQIIFTSGDDPEFAPVLNVKYKSAFANLNELADANSLELIVYPNPATNQLSLLNVKGEISSIEIIDLQGKVVKTRSGNNTNISLDDLDAGHYFVRVYTNEGAAVSQFIKK